MKNLSPLSFLIVSSLFVALSMTTSCSTDLASPIGIEEQKINSRSDFSGLEAKVRVKVSERDQIALSAIYSCYYYGQTSEGYGRYHLTTDLGFVIYTVVGIIGDDIEGW
jgi:hypothetical protein